MSAIKVEIRGELHDRDDCAWYETAPCGCLSGAFLAKYAPIDADAAWVDHLGSAREVKARKRLGFRFELGTLTDLPKPWEDCPHHPKWGEK